MTNILWSSGALLTGFTLDVIFGDPYRCPHIARLIGKLISALDRRLNRTATGGVLLVIIVIIISAGVPFAALLAAYRFFPPGGYIIESLLCWQLLAAKQLRVESLKVRNGLTANDVEGARRSVSMIVGRDTEELDVDGITRAAVETVAENASDGVVAPLLFIMLGGAALGCLYKAVNTMDSMIGYRNEKYIIFGRAAARLDDALSYIPSRLCAMLMIAGAFLLRYDSKGAYRIWRRDRRKHSSPNSAQTEAVCAGALGVRLAGPISYSGELRDKPYIGDDTRPVSTDDIISANRLMYVAAVLSLVIAVLFRWGVFLLAAI